MTQNGEVLYAYFLTSGSDDEQDEEPYRRWWELTGVGNLEAGPDTRTPNIHIYEHENTEKNRLDELGAEPIEGPGRVAVTFRVVDGREMIDGRA